MINKAIVQITKKILANHKVNVATQMFYLSLCTGFYSFVYVLFVYGSFHYDLGYYSFTFITSILFYAENYVSNMAMQRANLSSIAIIVYSQIIFILLNMRINVKIQGKSIIAQRARISGKYLTLNFFSQ